ncbi:MAG: LysR family transcriptional regulator [Pseudomonadota bacterium]
MELDQIRLFAEVARQGSFAAAARTHGLDPSSVSRAIASLEDGLGVRLFQRSTRRVSLTEAGSTFLRLAEPALDELDRARDAARSLTSGPNGVVRVTTSLAFGTAILTPALKDLKRQHPHLSVELVMSDDVIDLIAEKVDLAIRLGPMPSEGGVISKLVDTRYFAVASPDYLRNRPLPEEPEALSLHRCLRMGFNGRRSIWRFKPHGRGDVVEVAVDGDLAISSPLALREATRQGLGPALLPDWLVAGDIADGTLVDLLPDWWAAADSFDAGAWAVYPSRNFLPGKTRAVMDFLKRRMRRPSAVSETVEPAQKVVERH